MNKPSMQQTRLEYLFNPDGSVYHLGLRPGETADVVITVGDPGRVPVVSKYFDRVELKKANREFVTHTGWLGKLRLTVISTGIGTGNIDIVMNELDALANVNLKTGQAFEQLKQLSFIRIGTSGAIQPEIDVDSLLVSAVALGLDSLMQYYPRELTPLEAELQTSFAAQLPPDYMLQPYAAGADSELTDKFLRQAVPGITFTAPGFYAPQGRSVRGGTSYPDLLPVIAGIDLGGHKITNIEMETGALYGLAKFLRHKAISLNVILANRISGAFSRDPKKILNIHIANILQSISESL